LGNRPGNFWIIEFPGLGVAVPYCGHDLKAANFPAVAPNAVSRTTIGLGSTGFEHAKGIAQRHCRNALVSQAHKENQDEYQSFHNVAPALVNFQKAGGSYS
jgi:hypothetical protein